MLSRSEKKLHLTRSMQYSENRSILYILTPILIALGGVIGFFTGTKLSTETIVYDYQVALETPEGKTSDLEYGIWPELSNIDFFTKVRDEFLKEKASFIEANLTMMKLSVYKEGVLAFTVPIKSKGKEGSWWETPSGLYRAEGKEETHFSSFGHVYMPWSIPFQGNFFIHGWPYYPDGTPVKEGYSGGCIRLEDIYAQQVYEAIQVGTPILVFEEETKEVDFSYDLKAPDVEANTYLVADLENNFVLVSGNLEKKSETTVLSKMMSAVVASEYKNIEEEVPYTPFTMSSTEERSRFASGTPFTLYDIFYPLLLEDSNDAVKVLSEYFGKNRFMSLVEYKAKALGMKETSFSHDAKSILKDTTTAGDIFLFLKYLNTNRPFILSMSANKVSTLTYGSPFFSDIDPIHPLINLPTFVGGGATRSEQESENMIKENTQATVALAFSNQENITEKATEDIVTILELPFNGVERKIGFIVLDSSNPEGDTRALLHFVEEMYEE